MPLPIVLVHGDKRQHINGRFKEIQPGTGSHPVEAVLRPAARDVAFVGALRDSAALVGVLGLALGIQAHKHGVVVAAGLVKHPTLYESVQHLPVNAPVA